MRSFVLILYNPAQVKRALLDNVYTRRDFSGFVMNPERFSTGLVLPFTQKCSNPT